MVSVVTPPEHDLVSDCVGAMAVTLMPGAVMVMVELAANVRSKDVEPTTMDSRVVVALATVTVALLTDNTVSVGPIWTSLYAANASPGASSIATAIVLLKSFFIMLKANLAVANNHRALSGRPEGERVDTCRSTGNHARVKNFNVDCAGGSGR